MSIISLTPQNFQLVGVKQKTLNINVKGPVLVFFKQSNCRGCASFTPIFNKLVASEQRIRYAIFDLGTDKRGDVVKLSHQSTLPITHVPFVVFYIDGRPAYNFKERTKNEAATTRFVSDMISLLPQNSFVPQSHVYKPDIQQPSSMRALRTEQQRGGYHRLGNDDQEDDNVLIIPDVATPHNKPWDSKYKRMGTID